MDLGLRNKNVLIVGASKGIGRQIAIEFANEGSIITTIARSHDLLLDLDKELKMISKINHQYFVANLMQIDLNLFAKQILIDRGPFDVIVHNVGGSLVSRNALGTLDEWYEAWKFNAGIAIALNNVLVPPMIEKEWGRIVHISSISSKILRGNPLYTSSKAFLNAYVTTVGRTLANKGIVMSAIMPGAIAFPGSYWDLNTKTNPEKCNEFLKWNQVIGRFGTPKEVAQIVVFMASEQVSFMPATLVPVDGANM